MGLPADANERAAIAVDIMTKAAELGVPNESIIFDPLAMTVKGNQDQAMQIIETIEMFQALNDPPMRSIVGLSNIVSMCPPEQKGILTAVYWVMLREAGLTGAIIDPLEEEFMKVVRANDAAAVYPCRTCQKDYRHAPGQDHVRRFLSGPLESRFFIDFVFTIKRACLITGPFFFMERLKVEVSGLVSVH